MKDFISWFREHDWTGARPWLVLGKGPSFAQRSYHDLTSYNLLTLNHAIREQSAEVAHVIDLDVITACQDALLANAQVVVMPWMPHIDNRPSEETLSSLVNQHDGLRKLANAGMLLWYNLSTAGCVEGNSPVVPVRFFSAEAAIALLAASGAEVIRSLGVDGGVSYSKDFNDLKEKTLLSNGRKSFDRQFEQIARIIYSAGIDYSPLDVQSPVQVYVATTEAQMLATKVLEYSIRRHASMTIKVHSLSDYANFSALPRDQENQPRTPFSFQRFLIPKIQSYKGRAIYLDSDMQVFKDIRALWRSDFVGANVLCVPEPGSTGRRPQFSVMLLDCEDLDWDITKIVDRLDNGELTYEKLMYELDVGARVLSVLPSEWNSLECYSEDETALVHYTDMTTQPWISTRNPLAYLWFQDLFLALEERFISIEYVKRHVELGYIRPSILFQVDHHIADPLLLPRHALKLDERFIPPHATIASHGGNAYSGWHRLVARARHFYRIGPVYRLQRRIRDRRR